MNYDFLAPPRIAFGWGRRSEVGALAQSLGRRAFVVSGSRTLDQSGALDEIRANLRAHGVEAVQLATQTREPEVADVDETVARLLEYHVSDGDFVLAVGGGSAIDLGKAVAAMATNRHGSSVADFLEGVGKGLKIKQPPLPVMAMPTTAGTGSEATKNAVISSYDPLYKKSLRSDLMVPRVVLVDPELCVSVPPHITAATGMDAITQLIESYVSRRATPMTRALCLEGLRVAAPAIVEAVQNGNSRPAREAMSHAALLSGMALANSGLGLAHGIAAALGVHGKVTHGLACAMLLPTAIEMNSSECREDFTKLGEIVDGRAVKSRDHSIILLFEWVRRTNLAIGIPQKLSEVGICKDQIPDLVKASHGNSLSGNPRDVTDWDLELLLERLL